MHDRLISSIFYR